MKNFFEKKIILEIYSKNTGTKQVNKHYSISLTKRKYEQIKVLI